jgi:hypothetical protein
VRSRASLTGAALLGATACVPLGVATARCLQLPVDEATGLAGSLAVPQSAAAMALAALGVVLVSPWLARIPVATRLAVTRGAGIVLLVGAAVMAMLGLGKHRSFDDPETFRARIASLGCFDANAGLTHLAADGLEADLHWGIGDGTCTLKLTDEGGRQDTVMLSDNIFGGCWKQCLLRARGRAWLVKPTSSHLTSGIPLEALQGSPPLPRDGSVASFASELAPPRAWSLSALVGVLLAIAVLLSGGRDERLASLLGWHEQIVAGETVLVDPGAPQEAYRSFVGADGAFVVRTTHASVRADLARRRAGRWALAVTTIAVLGTPLAVAAAFGFLR